MDSYFNRLQKIKLGQLPKEAVAKKKKPIAKIGKKKLEEMKVNKGSDSELDLWFVAKRKEMVGRCLFCNQKTEKENDETYRRSIAHLLPKNKNAFPSVATHDSNFIELCFHNNSCHTNFDNGKITWEFIKDSHEWSVIKEKLLNILPMVSEPERKNKLYDKLIKLVYSKS
jgi:hypothetical protein